jgi:hypothetical protein
MNSNQPFSYFHYEDFWGVRRKSQIFQPRMIYYGRNVGGYYSNYQPTIITKQQFRPPPGVYFLFPQEMYNLPEIFSPCSTVSETSTFFELSECEDCELESPVTSRPSSPTKKYKKKAKK